jgi:hypothetical protein
MWLHLVVYLLCSGVEDRAGEVFNTPEIKLVLESFS